MVNRYFTAINLLLVAAGVYFGVSIFYAVVTSSWTGSSVSLPAGRAEPVVETAPLSKLADYQVIVERNLFNSGKQALGLAEKTAEAALDVEKLKQTELKVKLLGTTAGQVETAAAAFIEDPKTREHRMYRTGDTLQDAVIKMILREKVVLTRNGKDEVLIHDWVRRGLIVVGNGNYVLRSTGINQFVNHIATDEFEAKVFRRRVRGV